MRTRKPCTLLRRRRLGWNVRLGMMIILFQIFVCQILILMMSAGLDRVYDSPIPLA